MYDTNNVFYKILNNEIPCKKIYENEFTLAFYDINPLAKIHALVITKDLRINYCDFIQHSTKDSIFAFSQAICEVAQILGIYNSGFRLITNIGKNSGQEVPHYHVHILGDEKLGPVL